MKCNVICVGRNPETGSCIHSQILSHSPPTINNKLNNSYLYHTHRWGNNQLFHLHKGKQRTSQWLKGTLSVWKHLPCMLFRVGIAPFSVFMQHLVQWRFGLCLECISPIIMQIINNIKETMCLFFLIQFSQIQSFSSASHIAR